MGRFDTIKTTIDANIKENGSQEITGQKMNSVLTEMVNATDAELTELESDVNIFSGIYSQYGNLGDLSKTENGVAFSALYGAIKSIKLYGFEKGKKYAPFVIWREYNNNISFRIKEYDGGSWNYAINWQGAIADFNPSNNDLVSLTIFENDKVVEVTLDLRDIPSGFAGTLFSENPILVFSEDVFAEISYQYNEELHPKVIARGDFSDFKHKGFVRATTGILEDGGYYTTGFIRVFHGQIIRLYASASYSVAKIAAYQSDNEESYLINSSVRGSEVTGVIEWIVPIGVNYIRFSTSTPFVDSFYCIYNNSTSTIDAIIGKGFDEKQLNIIGGFLDKSDGKFSTHADFNSSDYIEVIPGTQYKCLFNASNNAAITFYDIDKSYINEFWQSNGKNEEEFVVPQGAVYMRLCNRQAQLASPHWVRVESYKSLLDISNFISNTNFDKKEPLKLFPMAKLPCLSFNFDDAPIADEQIVSLFEKYHLTCGFAIITDSSFKPEIYKGFQDKGFCILNHSVNGTIFTTGNYTYDSALNAIMAAKNDIENNGMICNGWVSPSSTMAADFLPILKMAHCYAFTSATTSATSNGREQDRCQLHRYSIESNNLEAIKSYIDSCIANDQIITLYGHAANMKDSANAQDIVFNLAHIESIIQYVIEKRNQGKLFIGNTDECVKYFFDL